MEDHALIKIPGIDIFGYLKKIVESFIHYYPVILSVAKSVFGYFVGLSIVLTVVLLIGIVYCIEGIKSIRKKEEKIYNAPTDMGYEDVKKGDIRLVKRWNKVLGDLESTNQNDWKQAIIEADVMLEELLVKLGYQGEGVGEMLRRATTSDFKTLPQAGEAHGVRNRIAHDASAFLLSHHEARRVINLYRQVFEEFYYI